MLDKHGLKMVGIKKTVGDMVNHGYWFSGYNQINYDLLNGKVWTDDCSPSNWVVYHDHDIVTIGTYCNKITMQQLADEIWCRLDDLKEVWEK